MSEATPSAHYGPVLRTPYEAPINHWRLDTSGRTLDIRDAGRRPSLPGAGIPTPKQSPTLWVGAGDSDLKVAEPGHRYGPSPNTGDASPAEDEPHRTINELRELVEGWRKGK